MVSSCCSVVFFFPLLFLHFLHFLKFYSVRIDDYTKKKEKKNAVERRTHGTVLQKYTGGVHGKSRKTYLPVLNPTRVKITVLRNKIFY